MDILSDINLLNWVTLSLSVIATILVGIWIAIPIKDTLLPYSRNLKDESVLVSRLAVRTTVFIFLLKTSISKTLIACYGAHGTWLFWFDIGFSLMILLTIIISIKIHPDGIKGL